MTHFTVMMWVRPTTLTSGRCYFAKGFDTSTNGIRCRINATTDQIEFASNEGTDLVYITNNAGITVNNTFFIVVTYSQDGTANRASIAVGTPLVLATERTYATQTEGSGAHTSNAAEPFLIGNSFSQALAFQGQIGSVHVTSNSMSTSEYQDQQFGFYPTTNTVLFVNNGFSETTVDEDWSGLANDCTVTGALRSSIGFVANFQPGGPF